MKTFDGYKKRALTDEYALLAGGGHKPLSEFSTSSHTHSVKINDTIKTISAPGGAAVDLGSYLQSILVTTALDNITWALTASNTYKRAFIYNTHSTEYSYLFGLKNDGKYGAILKMGYTDRYLRILRVVNGNWRSNDWEKISAGYADSAGAVAWANVTGKPSTFAPSSHNHPTSQINALTSYTKATAAAALATTDSLNTALGKLEYKLDVAYNLVTKANDSDGTIENLKEILNVLLGISDTETIKAIIGKYLPLAGGTMTGQILKAGVSSSWISGRSNAFLRTTTISGYSPFASIKTTNGSWEIGVYNLSSYYDDLIFSYCTDENYNNGNNSTTSQIRFFEDGTIGASITGNAATASKWANPRTITLTGSVTGSVSIDGSKDVTLTATTNHTHTFVSLTSKPTTLGGYGITDALKIDGSNGTAAGVSTLINKLTIGTSAPTDSDYYVCQYSGGGTSTTTYHRRPMSAMWSWIKAKTDSLYPSKTGTGASGTWPISITGNAATATNADKLDGYHASSFALSGHTHSYLLLAGGAMDNGARISHNGNLYLGRSDNAGWVLCQDMCSLASAGDTYWSLRTNGALHVTSATISGNVYAAGYYVSSDITLKTNFSKISTTVEQISNLPVFDFSWKDNLSSRNTGTSAQAVQTILPNIVTESKGSLKLDYGVLGTIAGISACKELVKHQSEIEILKLKNKELELEVKLLKSMIYEK